MTEQPKNDWKKVVWEWVESAVIALLLALVIHAFLFQPFKIPSGSMIPTLQIGDQLFVNKLAYGPAVLPVELRIGPLKLADSKNYAWWEKINKIRLPGFRKPERGDVIVFRYPVTRDKDFIKRLIALGGETVEIRRGKILINGDVARIPAIDHIYYHNAGDLQEGRTITVPQGHYFVLGDNSASSHDSRYWGFVSETMVIGHASCLFWPLNRIRWIK